MRAYRLTVLIVDHQDIGGAEIKASLENANHWPNDWINLRVVRSEAVEVEWTDEHPLNSASVSAETVDALFAARPAEHVEDNVL